MPGIFTLAGMGLQIPPGGLVFTLNDDGDPVGEVKAVRVRLDLWPTWLEIGCRATDHALDASRQLTPQLPDGSKATLLTSELQAGLVAVTAFAFSFDGFYDTLRNEWGHHPDEPAWRKNRTARFAQVNETLRYHLKLGTGFSALLRQSLEELFKFRGRAVRPDSAWVAPNYRPEIDNGVHPHLLTFSGPHARQCRAVTLVVIDRLLRRAAEFATSDSDTGWIDRGREEVDRLMPLYRLPGDEALAFNTAPSDGVDEPDGGTDEGAGAAGAQW